MTQTFTTRGPEELEQGGYTLMPAPTLEDTEQYKYWRKRLETWSSRIPGMYLPRNPDGSGGTPPREHQLRHASISLMRPNNFLSWTMGVGKCQKRGTELLMADGTIKKVEDVVVGDQLMGPDSKSRNVLSLARGREMMYKITSTKGDEYTVNESHILSLKRSGVSRVNGVPSDKWKSGDIVNISVRDFLKISPSVRKETYKQYKVPVDFPSQEVTLDPYFLGLWLGDGHSNSASITSMDQQVVDHVHDIAGNYGLQVRELVGAGSGSKASSYFVSTGTDFGGHSRNGLLNELKNLNLLQNKHIPKDFKINDRETRLQVLAGLLDSDGHLCNGKSTYEITQKNEALANDIVFLARSLGFSAYVKPVTKSCTYKDEIREGQYHKVSIWGSTHEIPVRLERKKAEVRSNFKDPLVCGINVEAIGEDDYYGFTLDGDHLYLMANFVVTHNTLTSLLDIYGWFGDHLYAGIDWDNMAELQQEHELETYKTLLELAASQPTLPPGSIHIVAPRHTLLQVWMKEMERVGLAQFAEVIDSESAVMNSRAPIFVYHFDFPKLQTDRGKRMNKQGGGQRLKAGGGTYFVGYPIAKVIAKHRPPSLMIVDEIHRIRPGTDRTRCLKIVRKKAKRVLGLTGTPMDGWVSQAAVILGFIYGENSRPYPFSDDEFSKRFTKTKATNIDIATGKETAEEKERPVPGVNHMQIPAFLRCTKPLMHRLNLGDFEVRANVVYPPVDSKRILVPMDFDQQLFYQAIHKSGMSSARQAFTGQYSRIKARNNMLSLMQGLRQASVAPWELGFKDTETALVRTVVDIVKAHKAEGRKGLIGTTFIEESRYIHEALKKAGLEGVRIYAQDPNAGKKILKQEDRELLIEKFMEDPDCVYLIANKELVAEGLNLAETASYTVSCSSGYRANVESQWLARVARPGQQWPVVDAYTLLNDGTIDIYIHQLLQAKISATSAMIDLDFTSDADVSPIDPIELAKLLAEADGDPLELSA